MNKILNFFGITLTPAALLDSLAKIELLNTLLGVLISVFVLAFWVVKCYLEVQKIKSRKTEG